MKQKQIPIRYIDKGLAYFCEKDGKKWIEININLLEFPELYKLVLEHELGHNNSNKVDFLYEIKDLFNFKKQRMITEFLKVYPDARPTISPLSKSQGVFEINWFLLLIWSIGLGIVFLVIWGFYLIA